MTTSGPPDDRTLPRETVERTVHAMQAEWTVADATLADDGHMAVYHLALDTGDSAGGSSAPETAVLKATPPEADGGGMRAAPRLLSLVAAETSIPVPDVYGVVDDDPDLPTPCFLMETVDDSGHVADHRDLGDDALETLARTTGRHLAELHDLDLVDAFGQVTWSDDRTRQGGQLRVDPDGFVVDGGQHWRRVLGDWIDLECEHLANTRFADRQGDLRTALEDRFDDLEPAPETGRGDGAAAADETHSGSPGSFEPVLARIDHGLHNVVLADADGSIAAVIDWAFTLAATRGYDLAVVSHVLHGDRHSYRDAYPTRRELVTDALLEGYRGVAGSVPADYRANRECYELLAVVRGMNHAEHRLTDEPKHVRDEIAASLRDHANEYV